jgi:hypothetical protein
MPKKRRKINAGYPKPRPKTTAFIGILMPKGKEDGVSIARAVARAHLMYGTEASVYVYLSHERDSFLAKRKIPRPAPIDADPFVIHDKGIGIA